MSQSGHFRLDLPGLPGGHVRSSLKADLGLGWRQQRARSFAVGRDPLPQITRNVRYKTGKPLENAKVVRAIKNAEQRLDGHGRLVIRPSGTETVIRVMGEGDDKSLVEDVVDGIVEVLADAAA